MRSEGRRKAKVSMCGFLHTGSNLKQIFSKGHFQCLLAPGQTLQSSIISGPCSLLGTLGAALRKRQFWVTLSSHSSTEPSVAGNCLHSACWLATLPVPTAQWDSSLVLPWVECSLTRSRVWHRLRWLIEDSSLETWLSLTPRTFSIKRIQRHSSISLTLWPLFAASVSH